MSAPLLYVTGTNTGVGKTTLAKLLLRRAGERNLPVAAMKPFCSGGREDAEQLHALQSAGLTLDEVNPFYFEAPISPCVAARIAGATITLEHTIAAIAKVRARNVPLLIEGAGGLLSPLGEKFTLLEIIEKLPGRVLIVALNTLGVINSALLTHRALANVNNVKPQFILMNSAHQDVSAATNGRIIREWTGAPVGEIPFLAEADQWDCPGALDDLLESWTGVTAGQT
jgi:dethiobiotin synthetase